jgi:shikimate kinase
MRVVLVGYRGTGKTTVGRMVAQALGWPFVDIDPLVEQRAGLDIAAIFARYGEAHFRDLESTVIADLADTDPVVISAGGGAVLRPENVQHLRCGSLVVWLTASAETLHKRIAGDVTTAQRRPNLTVLTGIDEIRHLLQVREPCYRSAADVALNTETFSPGQVAERILEHVRRNQRDE